MFLDISQEHNPKKRNSFLLLPKHEYSWAYNQCAHVCACSVCENIQHSALWVCMGNQMHAYWCACVYTPWIVRHLYVHLSISDQWMHCVKVSCAYLAHYFACVHTQVCPAWPGKHVMCMHRCMCSFCVCVFLWVWVVKPYHAPGCLQPMLSR